MKKIVMLLSFTCLASAAANAQTVHYTERYNNYSLGNNGFKTVAEQDAIMQQVVAERKRKAQQEEEDITIREKQIAKAREQALNANRVTYATRKPAHN